MINVLNVLKIPDLKYCSLVFLTYLHVYISSMNCQQADKQNANNFEKGLTLSIKKNKSDVFLSFDHEGNTINCIIYTNIEGNNVLLTDIMNMKQNDKFPYVLI